MIRRILFVLGAAALLAILLASVLTSRRSEKETQRHEEAVRPGYDDALAAAERAAR